MLISGFVMVMNRMDLATQFILIQPNLRQNWPLQTFVILANTDSRLELLGPDAKNSRVTRLIQLAALSLSSPVFLLGPALRHRIAVFLTRRGRPGAGHRRRARRALPGALHHQGALRPGGPVAAERGHTNESYVDSLWMGTIEGSHLRR